MSAAVSSPHRLSQPLGAVARLAHGSSGSTHSCCWHSLSAAPTVHMAGAAVGMGQLLAQGRCQQASQTLGTGGDGVEP